jgi:hypothetical protein
MSKLWVLGIAFALLLAAFPLISFGTTGDNDTLWWIGLGTLVLGALIAPVSRYVLPDEEDGDDPEESDEVEHDGDREDREDRDRSGRAKDADPAEIRVDRKEDSTESREAVGGSQPLGEHERLARAHEQRAEAHRERALAHEQLAEAEEERARAEAEGEGAEQRPPDSPRSDGTDGKTKRQEER